MTVAGGRDVQEPATNTESKVRGDKSCRGRRRFLLKFFSSEYFKEMLHWDSDSVYIAQCEDSVGQCS